MESNINAMNSKATLIESIDKNKPLAYLKAVVAYISSADTGVKSLVVFGSFVTGGFSNRKSDVDILVILDDNTPKRYKEILLQQIIKLEIKYGFAEEISNPFKNIQQFVLKLMGLQLSHFVCYKKDFIRGCYSRVFGIPFLLKFMAPAAKIAFVNLLHSAKTFWGEDLPKEVHITPVKKRHLLMSMVSVLGNSVSAFFLYPFSSNATRISMGALKAAIHNCSFCYGTGTAPLHEKTTFLISKVPANKILQEFILLRNEYGKSFRFVLGVPGISFRLYLKTLKDSSFPIYVKKT